MEKVPSRGQTVLYMKVTGKTINAKAKVSINGVTGMFTKETGKIIVLTVRAL